MCDPAGWPAVELPPSRAPGFSGAADDALADDRRGRGRCDGLRHPGGDQQDQWTIGVFVGVVDAGMSVPGALAMPRFHSEHAASSFYPRESVPNRLVVEASMPVEVRESLAARGHDIEVTGADTLGRVSLAGRRRGALHAAADHRTGEPSAAGR
ncbi:MAG: gamma-glutamyltransferase [Microbacteriaceae bacterium]